MNIVEGNLKDFDLAVSTEMEKSLKHFEQDLLSIRSGRATAAMVQDIKVDSYGQEMKIKAIATISIPDPRIIIIQPWDKGLLGEVVKAISSSDLGATPVIDSDVVRISLPIMSTDRREELVKVLNKKVEGAKIRIRSVRHDFVAVVRAAEKDKKISEDFAKRANDSLQKMTDSFVAKIDKVADLKEHELKFA